jgi:hypothetical protein
MSVETREKCWSYNRVKDFVSGLTPRHSRLQLANKPSLQAIVCLATSSCNSSTKHFTRVQVISKECDLCRTLRKGVRQAFAISLVSPHLFLLHLIFVACCQVGVPCLVFSASCCLAFFHIRVYMSCILSSSSILMRVCFLDYTRGRQTRDLLVARA